MTDDQNQSQQQTMGDLIRSARASGTTQKRQALAERFGLTPDTTGDEESAEDSEDSA